jgi:hypothetical protein
MSPCWSEGGVTEMAAGTNRNTYPLCASVASFNKVFIRTLADDQDHSKPCLSFDHASVGLGGLLKRQWPRPE